MLTLRNCANDKHNAWWDIEAEIQKELEALDARDNSYTSGNLQMEVVEEKEKVNIIDRVADDFENLMERFHLQNEKLLHFEQSVLSSGRCPSAFLEDTTAETFRGEGLDYAHSYSSCSCFLTAQHLIRPLYCLDQQDTLCFNGDRVSVENGYPRIKHKDSKKLEEEHEKGLMKEVQSGQMIVKETKKVKRLSKHAAKKTPKGQRNRIFENVKDTFLCSMHLNHKQSSLDEVKLKDSGAKSQKSAFLLDIALMSHQNKDKMSVSTRCETEAPSSNSCRTPYVHSIQSDTRNGRPLLLVSLDFLKWEVIVVNNVSYDVTRTRMFNQLDVMAHIGTPIDKYFSCSRNSVTCITDGCVLYAALSLLPQLNKVIVKLLDELSLVPQLNKIIVKFFDETGLPSQNPSTSCFSQQFSSICSLQLPSAHASIKDERQLFLETDYRQLVEKTKYLVQECSSHSKAQLCVLEQAHACDDGDVRAVLEKGKKSQLEISAHLKEIVKLQAMVKGFLARKHHRARLETEKRKLSFFVSKIQAHWRGCIVRRACLKRLERGKNLDLSEFGCLQCALQLECVKLDTPTHLRRIVILQALARGFLARKYHRTILLQEKQRMYYLASKVQALWKGRRLRTFDGLKLLHAKRMLQETAAVKFQALWRGFSTRRRFQMAIENSKYNDYDDFEYAFVDENDYLPQERCLEELATLCHQRSTHHLQSNLMSDTFQETIEDGVQIELNKQFREVCKEISYNKHLEPIKEVVQKEDSSAAINLVSSAITLADSDNPTIGHHEEVFKAELLDMCHHKTAGKKDHRTIDETNTALADIAKDWSGLDFLLLLDANISIIIVITRV